MLIEADVEQEVLEQCLESSYQQIQDQDGLAGLRAKAWKRYQELGLPDGRLEAYRYIQRKQLYAQRYSLAERVELDPALIEAALLPGCEGSALVMVNGCYCPDLSRTANLPEQLVVGGLEEAMRTYGAFLKNRWQRTLKEEQDPFVAANAALAPAGVFIYVPPKLKVDVPLQVIQLTAAGERPMLCLPRVVAFLGVQAELQVMHTAQHVSGESYGVNQVFDWTLDDGARVDFASFVEEEPATVWRLDAVRARLKRDAFFRTNSSSFGTKTHRQDYRVSLNGENACARLKGLWVTRDTRQVHSHVLIEHNAPHCE
jgi:Fe-S cluster assembly protein SufD